MENFALTQAENTSITKWNFSEIQKALEKELQRFDGVWYDDEKSAKNDKAQLNKLKDMFEDKRKKFKKECLAPYEAIEPQMKEIVNSVDTRIKQVDIAVKNYTAKKKEEKLAEIKRFYDKKSYVLGEYAEPLFNRLLNEKWLNATYKKSVYEEELLTAVNAAKEDITKIKALHSPFEARLLTNYANGDDLTAVIQKKQRMERTGCRSRCLLKARRKTDGDRTAAEHSRRRRDSVVNPGRCQKNYGYQGFSDCHRCGVYCFAGERR